MAEQDDDKTEEPTARRLAKAREQGQIPRSQEVNSAMVFVGLTVTFAMLSVWVCRSILPLLSDPFAHFAEISFDGRGLVNYFDKFLQEIGKIVIVPILMLAAFGLAANLIQTGFLFTTQPLTPNLEKFSPIAGLRRMFSLRQLTEFIKGLAKMGVVLIIGYVMLAPEMARVGIIVSMPIDQLLSELDKLIVKFLIAVVVFLVMVAVADYSIQVYLHRKQLRMTVQEVKDEFKDTEGDPLIKAKLRKIRMDRHRVNMRKAMQRATVLITNPTHFAVALEYDYEIHESPIVIAKGQDHQALMLRTLANEYGVTIVEDPPLARALYSVGEINQPIPEELFAATSNIIRFVYAKTGRTINGERVDFPDGMR